MATLYVDGEIATVADVSGMKVDAGDLSVGEGFSGNILGVRFSPGMVSPDQFMVAHNARGFLLIVR